MTRRRRSPPTSRCPATWSASGSCSAPRSRPRCCPRSSRRTCSSTSRAGRRTSCPSENVAIAGTTYDIEAINAVDFLMKEHGVKAGDTVGHLYFEGDYGENALKGSKYAAGKHGLKIVEQKITPADTDMTGQVAAFQRAGVKAILFSAAPPQAASLAGRRRVAEARRADRRQRPRLDAAAADHAGRRRADANYYVVSSMAPLSVQSEGVQKFLDRLQGGLPEGHAVLQRLAVRLRRRPDRRRGADEGVREQGPHAQGRARRAALARRALDTGGTVAGTLDFTDPAEPPSRLVYIAQGAARTRRAGSRRSASRAPPPTPRATSSEAAECRP